jgi:F0F1-type ATP synthase membrane subunit b/b'
MLFGAIAGGAIVWFYGDRIRELAQHKTHEAKDAVARGLESAQATAEGAIDKAKETVRSGFQAGQDYVRPENTQTRVTYR